MYLPTHICLDQDKKRVKEAFTERLVNAIKLHNDAQGHPVINPASLALFSGNSREDVNLLRSQEHSRNVRGISHSHISKHDKGRMAYR